MSEWVFFEKHGEVKMLLEMNDNEKYESENLNKIRKLSLSLKNSIMFSIYDGQFN